ncbi:MAG: hypothetical protein ABIU10_08990 [Sphingomicrobium sp.]
MNVIFGVLALLLGSICVSGLVTGAVAKTAGLHAERKSEPLAYWTYIAMWGFLALLAAWVAVQAHLTG